MFRAKTFCTKYLKKQVLYPTPQFTTHKVPYRKNNQKISPHEVAESEEKDLFDYDIEDKPWCNEESTVLDNKKSSKTILE